MTLRSVLLLTLLGALLSGCTGPGNAAAQSDAADPAVEAVPSQAHMAETVDEGDLAPSAILAANVTRGKAPLAVGLSITGGDPEGRSLTWALDFDGDGRLDESGYSLPAHVQHSFKAGTYAVRLAVDDGNQFTVTSIDIVAEA